MDHISSKNELGLFVVAGDDRYSGWALSALIVALFEDSNMGQFSRILFF